MPDSISDAIIPAAWIVLFVVLAVFLWLRFASEDE
jgi:hypothetical protein